MSAPEGLSLDTLQRRLGNEPTAELEVVREEFGKINRIRLDRLIEDAPSLE